jgi:exopolysaccharide production protein ExoZ
MKLGNIQALRGIAVLLVIFCHMQAIEQKYGRGAHLLPDWFDYAKASVDLFFVISGFVIATVTRGQFQSLRAARHFFFQRITRIYPPYWLYSVIVLMIWLYHPEMVNSAQDNQVNILASFLLLPQDLLPLLMVGWTLIHEMYFYIVIAMVMPVIPEHMFPFWLVLWALVVILGSAYFMTNMDRDYNPAIRVALHPFTLEFIGGAACALLLNYTLRSHARSIMVLGVVAFFVATLWLDTNDPTLNTEGWRRVLFFGIPALLVIHGAASAEIGGTLYFPKMLRAVGDASYSLYLSHVLVLSAVGRIWAQISNPGVVIHIVILVTMLLATLIVGLMSYRWVEVPILNKIRILRAQ